ncbi:MAG TPA: response regulator [Chitinophagaceae bacterium]|jgi:CheY-like chemotaxis protein|nr:response regulator [Chitinophagaceae bacterium]
MSNPNRTILIVEDDMVDVMTIKRAVGQLGITNPLHVESNGEEALHYLNAVEELPGLVILDLNMPKMNGTEFLKHIREDDRYKSLPVVVLTTSKEQQDKLNTFNLFISGYMIKPVDFSQFKDMVRTIHHYWELSELPY